MRCRRWEEEGKRCVLCFVAIAAIKQRYYECQTIFLFLHLSTVRGLHEQWWGVLNVRCAYFFCDVEGGGKGVA